jgi:photosystem II stability/assembly factor-like uncharacterized protein
MWFQSLQMTSATSGWGLDFSANPAYLAADARMLLVRTADSARTWADVTPSAARPMLATTFGSQALDPVDSEHAYLAVTAATQDTSNSVVNTTAVFATVDGGRTWAETTLVRAAGTVTQVSFADARHGWLLLDTVDSATGQSLPCLFRTTDGGRHWSPAATAPPPGSGGMNDFCQKLGMTFPTATTGWLNIRCRSGAYIVVTHDGGSTWTKQPLPVPADPCASPSGPCDITGPQFTGGAGFLTVAPETSTPAASLLVSHDAGHTWQPLTLPSGAGQYPQITFFGPADGVLVAAGPQEALGTVFYTTADGGQTWTPVKQGTHLTQFGATIDLASPQAGFAWAQDGDASGSAPPPLDATTNAGRTWTSFTPHLTS